MTSRSKKTLKANDFTPNIYNFKVNKKHIIYTIVSQLISQLHFLSSQVLENEPKEDIIVKQLEIAVEKIKTLNESGK